MDIVAKVLLFSIGIITAVNFLMFLGCLKLYTEMMKEGAQQRRHGG